MKRSAFTLVELIVVITILAILGTIAFISLQGYSSSARDSTRISDIGSIKKVLELYAIDNAKYPDPSEDKLDVVFSGGLVWTQGTFGETVQQDTGKISVVPVDPLTKTRYAYSVLNTKKEYELGTILEGELSKLKTNITNAEGDKIMTSHVTGNYNGKVAKVEANSTTYVLAVPTIINADLSETDYQTIVNNQALALKGTNTLPGSYTGTVAKLDGTNQTIINPSEIVIHTGDIDTIDNSTFVNNLQDAFSGTTSVNNTQIEELMSISSGEEDNYASNIINYNLGGNVVVVNNDTPISYGDWRDIDTNCNLPDVTIGGLTWAGCNSTLGNGLEWGQLDSDIGTNNYNGSVGSACYDYTNSSALPASSCEKGDASMSSSANAKNWFDIVSNNGIDTENSNIWGKFYVWDNAMGTYNDANSNGVIEPSEQGDDGACPAGRHIPSDSEIWAAENVINGITCRTNNGWQCSGLGWDGAGTLASALNLPLSGGRHTNASNYINRGRAVYLWTSSYNQSNNDPVIRTFDYSQTGIYRAGYEEQYAFIVRCVKD